jgi:hypothetical protein
MTMSNTTPKNRLQAQLGRLATDHRAGDQLDEPFAGRRVEPHVRRLTRVPPPDMAPRRDQPRPDPRGRGGAAAPARGPIGVRRVAGRTVRLDGRAGPPPAPAGAVNIREGEIRGSWIGRPTPLPNPAHAPRFGAASR